MIEIDSWSPDGKQIAFHARRTHHARGVHPLLGGIYVVDVDGADQRGLTNGPAFDIKPRWSPTGGSIAFYSSRHGASNLFVMDSDGANQRALTKFSAGSGGARSAAWSPDGERLAFTSRRGSVRLSIYVVDADDGRPRVIANEGDYNPTWSHDGRRIAFASRRDGHWAVYVMDADGRNQRRLTNRRQPDGRPSGR